MTYDELHELAPLHALDALDGDERDAFEAHLASCEQCRTEVDELRSALAELPATEVAPPQALRASVLASIESVDQVEGHPPGRSLRALPGRASSDVSPAGSVTPGAASAAVNGGASPEPDAGSTGRGRAWWVGAAAAAVVAIIVGIGIVSLGSTDGTGDEVAAVLELPDASTVSLSGDSGTMELTYSTSTGRAALVADDLGSAPPGETYQLWAISGETPRSAGVFEPDDEGVVQVPIEIADVDADAWAVTVEPAGGSSSPTGDIIMIGETS